MKNRKFRSALLTYVMTLSLLTAHVDHTNVLYQIPAEETGNPMVYLHGYGQSRMGWMTTSDGRDGDIAFAEQYNADGGDCTVVNLPDEGMTGNSHFLFQELNNEEIADHVEAWLASRGLAAK